jgi:choline dehydrogenase
VLGGSSSINGMIFQRGNPMDYERWAADPGMADWDYAHCLPYFKRMENCLAADRDDAFRGHSGPLVLERGPATNPLFQAFFAACREAGYHLTEDVNGYRQEGFAPIDRNIHNGRRLSAACAYLHLVMSRPNLEVRTRSFVTRIPFEGTRAVGVVRPSGSDAPDPGWEVTCRGSINSRRRSRSRASATPRLTRSASTRRDLPGSGEPPGSPRYSSCRTGLDGPPALRGARGSASSGCSSARVPEPRTTSRAEGSRGATTTSPTRT